MAKSCVGAKFGHKARFRAREGLGAVGGLSRLLKFVAPLRRYWQSLLNGDFMDYILVDHVSVVGCGYRLAL